MKLESLTYIPAVSVLVFATQAFAVQLDCTEGCDSQAFAGGVYTTAEIQPTGTGVFDAFVQLQNNGNEQGYNTTVNGVFDNGSSDQHNHEITLSTVPLKEIEGTVYREFLLDLNESANTSEISLDGLQLYLSDTPNQSTTNVSSLGTLVYDLDAATDNAILLDQAFIGSGSGNSDLFVYIPQSLFAAALASVTSTDPYLYLWSQFGLTTTSDGSFDSDAGFEEWGKQSPGVAGAEVPEPMSLALLLLGAGSISAKLKRARSSQL